MTDTITTLLNKVEALIDCGFVSLSQVGRDINERRQRVSEWVTAEKRTEPRASVYMKLHDWCAEQTKKMCLAPKTMQAGYRRAYKEVCERRGNDGRN